MKRALIISYISLSFITSCGQEAPVIDETVAPNPLTVQLTSVNSVASENIYDFPATVTAVKTVDLNFEVAGRLNHVDLTQGKRIKKGHLLATIDSAPYEREIRENRARAKQAKLELERIQSLVGKGMASKKELDNAETQFEIRTIDLENSIQDLSYTRMTSPFDALVSERLIENNSYMKAGDIIARIQDVSKVYFEFNVPERVLTANINNKIKNATAYIGGSVKQKFEITYVEHTTQPDPVTQTYKVIFAMDPVEGINMTPGARASVEVILENHQVNGLMIPFRALVADKNDLFYVWKFDPKSSTVSKAHVTVSAVRGNYAGIASGLAENDKIVSAGISAMQEGMSVIEYIAER